jgi:integrase
MKGHLRKRGPNTYAAVIELGKDATGKRRQKWITLHGTKKACEAELTRLVHELNTGMYAEPDRILTRDYFKRWLEDYAQASVAPRTYERYAEIINLHLAPALGHIPLQQLRPLHIQAMEAEMLRSGSKRRRKETVKDNEESPPDPPKGLSARTVLHHHRVLHAALEQAVKWQLLARNPADAVRPPRPDDGVVSVIDEDGIALLLNVAKGTSFYIPVLLAATTGLRRGEILGLRWQDVDLRSGTLAICQALSRLKTGPVFTIPKTAKSKRTLALPRIARNALVQHRKQQAKERLRLGPVFCDHGLVCPAPDGRPWHPGTFTGAFRDLAKRAGVNTTFHGLRHSHATLLLRQGVHPKIVSERLGHSSIGLTLDTYSHVLPGMQEDAAAKVDSALARALRNRAR